MVVVELAVVWGLGAAAVCAGCFGPQGDLNIPVGNTAWSRYPNDKGQICNVLCININSSHIVQVSSYLD